MDGTPRDFALVLLFGDLVQKALPLRRTERSRSAFKAPAAFLTGLEILDEPGGHAVKVAQICTAPRLPLVTFDACTAELAIHFRQAVEEKSRLAKHVGE